MSAQPEPRTYGALPMPLQDGEIIYEFRRRHWWFLWPQTILYVLVAIVPVALAYVVLDAIGIQDDIDIFFWLIALVWVGWWAIRALLNWYRYSHDVWIVTNQRLIDSFKAHPFSHRLSTADLINVQDIAVSKVGLLATMLNFGDVICETAGSNQQFRIIGIPRPEAIQLMIDKERDRERNRLAGPGTATNAV
ncbi:MAG: hypothetical protein WD904_04915 [Dehalococcoidia bacterium]